MKTKILITAILFTITLTVFGKLTETEKQNWEKLDWILRGTVPGSLGENPAEINLKLWKEDVYIGLEGDYNNQDSLEIKKVMEAFDKAIPFRNFYWAMDKRPTLTILFTNLGESLFYPRSYLIDHTFYSPNIPKYSSLITSNKLKLGNVYKATLYLRKEPDREKRNKIIWHGFAKILADNNKATGFKIVKQSVMGGELSELTKFDKFFFRTIYSPDFFRKYNQYLSSNYNIVQILKYVATKESKAKMILVIQFIVFGLLAYLIYNLCWKNWLKQFFRSKLYSYLIIGYLLIIPALTTNILYYYLKYEFLFPNVAPPSGNSNNYMTIVAMLLFYSLILIGLYIFEQVIFRKTQKFYKKQIVRTVSILLLYIALTSFNFILGHPPNFILLFQKIKFVDLFIYTILFIGIRLIIFHNQNQKEQIRIHQQIKIDAERQLQTKFQLEAIQARTNPHFLYNSLNTIASLAKQDADKTEEFALKLSKLLRLRLAENPPVKILLSQEIETIKLYLEIEKERFSDRFYYSFDLPVKTDKIIVPSFILLHLVENAIKHGISKISENGEIKVRVAKVAETVLLKVTDNGPDFPESPIYGTGIKNILEKLEILYPEKHEFAISNTPTKFVQITLNS